MGNGHVSRADLTEQVYTILREWVVTRRIEPGSKVSLQELATEFRVSRSPVHDALTRLCSEGLVIVKPRKGYYITELNEKAAAEAYEVRLALEMEAAEKTVGSLSGQQLAELRRLMERTLGMIEDDGFVDKRGFIRTNQEFHNYQIDLAGNSIMSSVYRSLAVNLLMDRILFGQTTPPLETRSEHLDLMEAFEAADLHRVRMTLRKHCRTGMAIVADAIKVGGGVR